MVVVTNPTHHRHRPTESGGSYRLVGALATTAGEVLESKDGFPGQRVTLGHDR